MADDQDEWEPDASLPVHPDLQSKFRNFTTDAGQSWGAKAIAIIQAHNDARAMAERNQAIHQQFITNLDRTKQSLIGLVKGDPTALNMAMQLAAHTVDGLAGTNPGLSKDQGTGVRDSVTSHMQQEIAHAAVQSMANNNGPAAHKMLDGLGDVLPEGDIAGLRQFTNTLTAVRQSDAQAQQMQLQAAAVRYSGATALAHLGALQGPNGELQFPPGWGQTMVQHPGLLNSDKAGLWGAFDRLRQSGDAPNSDPTVLVDLLTRAALAPSERAHPNTSDVISQVGNGLNISDAKFLGGLIGPQPPQQREVTKLLADTMSGARDQIGNDNAFARFSNWFIPAYKAGALDLDPSSKNFALTPERMQRFQPSGDDIIAPAVLNDTARPALGDIFANPRGFAMRREQGTYMQSPAGPTDFLPRLAKAARDTAVDIAGVPNAVVAGVKQGLGYGPTVEEVGAKAYAAADFMPVHGDVINPEPRETMANMPGASSE